VSNWQILEVSVSKLSQLYHCDFPKEMSLSNKSISPSNKQDRFTGRNV
jgi:hypothetical protein